MDPILTAIAGALAKEAVSGGARAAGKLVRFVREKFRHDPGAEVVLASAQENPDDTKWVDALAKVLDRTGEADPAFATELRALWTEAKTEISSTNVHQTADNGGTINSIGGSVGKNSIVLQVGNLRGGIHDKR